MKKSKYSQTKTYMAWSTMKQRCRNPNNKKFHRYGGRGISVCNRWQTFKNFHEDMGNKPDGYSLERIDNDGNYCLENCRWATPKEQANNTRRNINFDFNGEKLSLSEISRITGVPYERIYYRIFGLGMTFEDALNFPKLKSGPKSNHA